MARTDADKLKNQIVVRQPSDFLPSIDSTKEYFIDGIIDMGNISIEVPATGIELKGYSFDTSKLISSADNYTMFTSPVGGSGNVLGASYAIEVTGTNSQVYDLKSATGFDAFEFSMVNYNDCTSLGVIDSYRQGLEVGTGRFWGTPTLTLEGTWLGGYRITTSIVRGLDPAMNAPLFQAGGGFTMESRFLTDINIDLGATASLLDFSNSNFPNPSTLQLHGTIISRNGVIDAEDTTIVPNITNKELASEFLSNQGLPNTFVGGMNEVTVEIETVINTAWVYEFLDGTWTSSDLQHFDSPANGQLRHLGNNPREYKIQGDLTIDWPANNELDVRIRKFNSSSSTFETVYIQRRQVNNIVGGRDVAFYTLLTNVILDQNDYIFLEVANIDGTQNVTVENGGFIQVETRG